ncbi:MAG: nicotinate-nucleotide adenylyltransferase [Bacteroidota bacterium]
MAARGILGGTFDPIHTGHLCLAESAREVFQLERVIFVPAGNPPHKPGLVAAAAQDRFRMVEIATADNPNFLASPVELERLGPSYTIDTVNSLRTAYPGLEWCLIMGSDTLAEIQTWRDYRSLLPLVTILAAVRPGVPLVLPPELQPWAERVKTFSSPALDISATMIRQRLGQGLSVRYLIPAGVASYIEERGLYRQ